VSNTYQYQGEEITVCSTIVGCHKEEVIIFDGANKLISSSETPMRIIGEDFNWVFPYLMNGNNNISISGKCAVKFEWTEPRKVGQL
jgi:hypothetical protein